MTPSVAPETLDSLDWATLVERLARHARTPGGRARCIGSDPAGLLAPDAHTARARLEETREARRLADEGELPSLGGVEDIAGALERAERGGALTAAELVRVASALGAVEETVRVLGRQADRAPRLAATAAGLPDPRPLRREIDDTFDAEGQIRDEASAVLAEARASVRRLSAEISHRLERALRDPAVEPHLSDQFVTVRNERYVLPVRADARSRVPGIVHDASASGTTLFVEPEAVVELNNRLREAELRIERETARILRELSEEVGREAPAIRASLERLAEIDLALARAALAEEQRATAPELTDDGVFRLPELRHPLLPPDEAVPNDLCLGEGYSVLVLSGPNAGGKTVAMKAVALAALCARAGLHVCAGAGARVPFISQLLADIGDAQSLRDSLSTFSAHMARLAHIVQTADAGTLVVLDEIGDGTDPGEGAALAQAVLEALADAGARVVATTHYNLLKEMAALDPRFENASFEFDAHTLAPTYRLRPGVPGVSSAAAVAARMGLRHDVLERAEALLAREDRRLERMLGELATSRLALERERRELDALRTTTERERADVRARLADLETRREQLVARMRSELDARFRSAHEEVAAVIRRLQREGTAQQAARAREEILAVEARARAAQEEVAPAAAEPAAPDAPVDWERARPGDRVRVRDGAEAELLARPDRRGRVALRVGGARMMVPAERVVCAGADGASEHGVARPDPRVHVDRGTGPAANGSTCDVRGMRAEEALARVDEALDRAALDGRAALRIIHGLGTGRLRDALRAHLARSPYVTRFAPGPAEAGGEGVTEVELGD